MSENRNYVYNGRKLNDGTHDKSSVKCNFDYEINDSGGGS